LRTSPLGAFLGAGKPWHRLFCRVLSPRWPRLMRPLVRPLVRPFGRRRPRLGCPLARRLCRRRGRGGLPSTFTFRGASL